MRAPGALIVRFSVLAALVSPLEQSPGLTSGFGEYREGRFHAGIDYSTENRTGRPVRAVGDGWVERVRASGVGYGRSVYLRLADGRTAVYGHLSRFAPPLDAWVAAKQDSTGQYEQDLFPPPRAFPFRAGEVLAWSGESGAGPPHLHLEIRRGDMNLHPLRQGITAADATPPSITAVTLEPAGPRGRVGGGLDPWRGSFAKTGELTAPVVTGPFRLKLDTFDRSGDRPNHVATYRLRASLDGAPAFEAVLDSMSWDEMPIADRVFDLAATQAGRRDRRLLQSTPNDRSGIVRRGVPVWSLAPGPHRIEFTAEDEAGNVTTRALSLEVAESGPAADRRARTKLVDEARPGRPALQVRDLAVLVAARSGDAPPWIVGDDRFELADSSAVAGGTVWALVPKGALTAGPPDVVRAKEVSGHAFGGGHGDPQFSWDSLAFHEPVVLLARADTLVASPGDDLVPVASRLVTLEPRDLALAKPIRISWTGDRATAGGRGFGIFRKVGGQGWSLVAGADSSGRASGTTRRLGTFALLADTTAPRIVPPSRYTARANQPAPAFSVRLSDRGSGLSAADQRVLYDGRRVPAEYDPEAGRLTWRPRAPLAAGAHVIVVEAVDALGNRSSVRVPVAVR